MLTVLPLPLSSTLMSTETLKSLTEDELAMLLYLVNTSEPKMFSYDLNPMELRFIHLWKFHEILSKGGPVVIEEAKPIFNGLVQKLGLS